MRILKDDKTVGVLSITTDLAAWYAEHGFDPATHTVEYTVDEQRFLVRQGIFNGVADLPSLVGTNADATAIALHAVATLMKALDTAADVSDLKTAMAPFLPALSAYHDQLAAQNINLPYLAKGGLGAVMPEIEAVGTQVAALFEPPA